MFEGYNYVDKNGGPAKRRFSDPNAVRAVYQKLTEDDLARSERRLRIRKLYDGNLPYSPEQLEASGLKNLTNVNFYGLKGTIDNRADVILRLQSDTANLIELRPIARELAGPDAARIANVVAEEFSTTLREEGEFITALARMNKEADLYGLGPITWPSDMAYIPVALERAQIRFKQNDSVVSSANELYMFESTLTADYLQSLRDNREIAAQEGWQMDQVDQWFVSVFRDGAETRQDPASTGSTTPAESQQSMYRRNMIGEDGQFDEFHVIHVFVKEVAWPRGITHIMMPSTADAKFLYYKQNAYRTMDECFMWFPYSTKDRYAAEVRGLGSYLYPIERLKNRFLCQLFDSGFRASSLVLSTNQGSVQASQLTVNECGPYTVLPPGVTPAQSQISPNFQQIIGIMQVLDQTGVASTLGQDKRPLATTATKLFAGTSEKLTKAEQELQQAVEAHKTEAEFAQRKSIIDKVCQQSFRRAMKLMMLPEFARVDFPEIQRFLDRCAMRGVTLKHIADIPKFFTIVACRDLALGADGKVAELDAFHQLYAGELDEAGRRAIARRRAQLRFGQKDADEFIPEQSRDQMPTDQSSFAVLENNMMKHGMEAQVGMDQLHWSHIPVHSMVLKEIADMVAAPADNTPETNEFNGDPEASQAIGEQTLANVKDDPKRVLSVFVMCSKHIQEHLAIGGKELGMEAKAKQAQQMLRDLRPTIKALNLAVATQERVEQARREQAQRDEEKRIDQVAAEKARVAQIEADSKAATDRYRIDREHEVAMHKAELEATRLAGSESRDATRFANEESRRDQELQAKIDREREMTRAKTNAANAISRMNAVQDATGFGTVRPEDVISNGPADYNPL